MQRRIDGGSWTALTNATTLTYANCLVGVGRLTEFRVAARDKRGNLGAWAVRVVDLR